VDFLIVVVPVELIVVIVSGDYIAVVVVVELCVDTEVVAQLAYFADNWTCYNNYCVVAVAEASVVPNGTCSLFDLKKQVDNPVLSAVDHYLSQC
jgi:hypothetical protein